jgi:hypothetical protein
MGAEVENLATTAHLTSIGGEHEDFLALERETGRRR